MKVAVTAVVAAFEAACVALTVFAVLAVSVLLLWWLKFDFAADPSVLLSLSAALWQLTHFVPFVLPVSAQTALDAGLPAEAITVVFSLAPLGLTLVTVIMAYRSGWRFAGRGGAGASALIGGAAGFSVAAMYAGMVAADFVTSSSLWLNTGQPTLVYAVPLSVGFMARAVTGQHAWWQACVRQTQQAVAGFWPTCAAVLPARIAETLRLAGGGLTALIALGAAGVAAALVIEYIDVITLMQGLHVDAFGALLLFLLQLVFLPVAWIWALAWFSGSGFAVGIATSVTPFETLTGPLPALPMFGAIPQGWALAGGVAPALVVTVATVLGSVCAGRAQLRRASTPAVLLVALSAALLIGSAAALLAVCASGAIGPERLAVTGPNPWQLGWVVTVQFGFGMSLGLCAKRADISRVRDLLAKYSKYSAATVVTVHRVNAPAHPPTGNEDTVEVPRESPLGPYSFRERDE